MSTELKEDEFTAVYQALTGLFPDKPWVKRVASLQHQINETPTLRALLWRQNLSAYGLNSYDSYGMTALDTDSWSATKQAMIFAAQVVHVCSETTPENSRKFCGRVRDAINKPGGMRGLRFELTVATHLNREGCEIFWMEDGGGNESFDILARFPHAGLVEVECKCLSADRGEAFSEQNFCMLIDQLVPLVEQKLPPLDHHFYGISLTFGGKVPESAAMRSQLVVPLAEAIGLGELSLEGICKIDLRLGNLQAVQHTLSVELLNAIADELMGAGPGHRFIKQLGEHKYLAIDIQSLVPSKFEAALENVAKTAIRNQMTGNRPGCLVIGVERHSGPELELISTQEFSSLARRAEKLLANPEYAHLAAIVFVSAPSLESAGESLESEQSRTYVFENLAGDYPNLGLCRFFGLAATALAISDGR